MEAGEMVCVLEPRLHAGPWCLSDKCSRFQSHVRPFPGGRPSKIGSKGYARSFSLVRRCPGGRGVWAKLFSVDSRGRCCWRCYPDHVKPLRWRFLIPVCPRATAIDYRSARSAVAGDRHGHRLILQARNRENHVSQKPKGRTGFSSGSQASSFPNSPHALDSLHRPPGARMARR